ncbi:MAG: hypothetical protein K0S11_413 [Gammaproteobacteria bacterium]|jgi:hypothetical protein|nr:hypothetical protein [Gammaproteobacteria bacterium]
MLVKKSSLWVALLLLSSFKSWAVTVIPLETFNQIQLKGAMQVEIQAGKTQPKLYLEATHPQPDKLKLTVQNGVLIINQSVNDKAAKPKLIIHAPKLTALTVEGENEVKITHLHTTDFSLLSANQGNISIQGVVGLKRLITQGTGTVYIYWLNTSELTVNASGDTKIVLGGKVNTLHATLTQAGSLNARYLATTNAYIRTAHEARADVAARQILDAQAVGHSNIYYYQQPAFLGQHMYERGSVLNVVGEPLVN